MAIFSWLRVSRGTSKALEVITPLTLGVGGYLLHPEEERIPFIASVSQIFLWLLGANTAISLASWAIFYAFSSRRLQHEKSQLTFKAIVESAKAFITIACIGAWPWTMVKLGKPTAFADTLEEASPLGIPALYSVKIAIGILGADAWNYWKHYTLHIPALFAIHRVHHQFKDPNVFAGFAIHPIEALATFFPLLFVCQNYVLLWWPLHAPFILFFILLNFYLHCGFDVPFLEKLFPKLMINTSVFHNLHHERTVTHFGEMLTLWDRVMGTDNDVAIWLRKDRSKQAEKAQ